MRYNEFHHYYIVSNLLGYIFSLLLLAHAIISPGTLQACTRSNGLCTHGLRTIKLSNSFFFHHFFKELCIKHHVLRQAISALISVLQLAH